jgi:hypothetical protein
MMMSLKLCPPQLLPTKETSRRLSPTPSYQHYTTNMSGNAQGLLQPQIFESLQKKIDEETEVREVSTSG